MQETNVFFTKIRTETDEKTPPMQYANGDISSVIYKLLVPSPIHVATHPISRVHASNITCQKLQWSEIEPPQ